MSSDSTIPTNQPEIAVTSDSVAPAESTQLEAVAQPEAVMTDVKSDAVKPEPVATGAQSEASITATQLEQAKTVAQPEVASLSSLPETDTPSAQPKVIPADEPKPEDTKFSTDQIQSATKVLEPAPTVQPTTEPPTAEQSTIESVQVTDPSTNGPPTVIAQTQQATPETNSQLTFEAATVSAVHAQLATDIKLSALDLIGNTPLLAFDRLYTGPGRLLVKCEFMNPTGSLKDRSSLFMIQKALQEGKLKNGGRVYEVTSGNQGCGAACVAAVLGHPFTATMSVGNSPQRAIMMRALGANIVTVAQVEGKPGNVTLADVKEAEKHIHQLMENDNGCHYLDQFHNQANIDSHRETTGPEIWRQTGERVDAFVMTCGTGGCFTGVAEFLKSKNPAIKCIVTEPEGSQPVAGKPISKPLHLMQGSGYGCIPNLFDHKLLDGTLSVTDEEVIEYRRLIGAKEGLYVGFTAAANVASACKLLKSGELGVGEPWVITVLCDTGLKYPD